MRYLVLSDTHGFSGRLGTLLMKAEAEGPYDGVFHLGDGFRDMEEFASMLPPLFRVAGNGDFFCGEPLFMHDVCGARLLLTHGHLQHVKAGLDALYALAAGQGARAALYGHTHVQKMEWRNGILLLNPGAACAGCYAVLTVNRLGAVDAVLYQ